MGWAGENQAGSGALLPARGATPGPVCLPGTGPSGSRVQGPHLCPSRTQRWQSTEPGEWAELQGPRLGQTSSAGPSSAARAHPLAQGPGFIPYWASLSTGVLETPQCPHPPPETLCVRHSRREEAPQGGPCRATWMGTWLGTSFCVEGHTWRLGSGHPSPSPASLWKTGQGFVWSGLGSVHPGGPGRTGRARVPAQPALGTTPPAGEGEAAGGGCGLGRAVEVEEKTCQLAQGWLLGLLALGSRWAGGPALPGGDPGLQEARNSQIRPDSSREMATDLGFPTAGQRAAQATWAHRGQDSPAL